MLPADHSRPEVAAFFQAARADPPGTLVALDVDGTISRIAAAPQQARLHPRVRSTLRRLSTRYGLWLVSGRDADEAQRLVGIPSAGYVGAHGLEVLDGQGLRPLVAVGGVLPLLAKLAHAVVVDVPEAAPHVERKRWSVAFHYRAFRRPSEMARRLETGIRAHIPPGLRVLSGKMVYEVVPDGRYDKGTALRWLIDYVRPRRVLAAGDDMTDVAMFRTLAEASPAIGRLTVAVRQSRETPQELVDAADVVVDGIGALHSLLRSNL